jgi:acetyl-CoA synthetase (ADP-forming)
MKLSKVLLSLIQQILQIIINAKAEKRKSLYEYEAKTICAEVGIPTPNFSLVTSPEKAVEISDKFGYPVVLKIMSPQIIHKSDVGGVQLNLQNSSDVKQAYKTILENVKSNNPDAVIQGILVQKMAPPSHEIIVGATIDPQFGPTIMLGMGGIYVEIYKDVTFRVAPIKKRDAIEMIDELKGMRILKGYRGQTPSDIKAVIDLILKVSDLAMNYQVINQIDLNPTLVYEKGLQVVDARIILK